MEEETLNAIGSKVRGYDRNKENPLFVITNKDMAGGINALLIPDFLKEISTELGGDYYVMTCSTDFAIIIAEKDKWAATQEMMNFAEKVATVISGIDNLLTNRLYRYNSQAGIMDRVN